jgi:hypothetical protein
MCHEITAGFSSKEANQPPHSYYKIFFKGTIILKEFALK